MSALPQPVACRRHVISHYECPMCGKVLGGYRTTTKYIEGTMEVAARTRTFKPCGCVSEQSYPEREEQP